MSFERDLLQALARDAAREGTNLAAAKRRADPIELAHAEIALLRAQLSALTRVVAALAAQKIEGGGGTLTEVGRHLLARASPIELDTTDDETQPLIQTAYRGSAYGDGAYCARCGGKLDPDEPEMSLAQGRVCTSCFAHGE